MRLLPCKKESFKQLTSPTDLELMSIRPICEYVVLQVQLLYEAPIYLRNKIIFGSTYSEELERFRFTNLQLAFKYQCYSY